MGGIRWGTLLGALFFCHAAGAFGALFTARNIPTWYARLPKPSFQPPNWVFAPVWTVLYTLMGVSLYRLWVLPEGTPGRSLALGWFFLQWFLNVLWTPVFFGWHRLWTAFAVIVLLWGSLVGTWWAVRPLDPWANYLWLPYLLWVAFAALLNYSSAKGR